jgi:ATP-dependent Clp protease ATP-binding subunit ClpA
MMEKRTAGQMANNAGSAAEDAPTFARAMLTLPEPVQTNAASFSIPTPLTRLIGREREKQSIANLLQREKIRLVTLTGPGGVGKTRMAI